MSKPQTTRPSLAATPVQHVTTVPRHTNIHICHVCAVPGPAPQVLQSNIHSRNTAESFPCRNASHPCCNASIRLQYQAHGSAGLPFHLAVTVDACGRCTDCLRQCKSTSAVTTSLANRCVNSPRLQRADVHLTTIVYNSSDCFCYLTPRHETSRVPNTSAERVTRRSSSEPLHATEYTMKPVSQYRRLITL